MARYILLLRFITDEYLEVGFLTPSNVPGLSVLDVLKQKHPESSKVVPSSFMCCDPFPPLSDLDITAGHVEKVALQIQGATGPGGSSALQRHDYFYGLVVIVLIYRILLLYWHVSCQIVLLTEMISML